jgi:hypothetical protein
LIYGDNYKKKIIIKYRNHSPFFFFFFFFERENHSPNILKFHYHNKFLFLFFLKKQKVKIALSVLSATHNSLLLLCFFNNRLRAFLARLIAKIAINYFLASTKFYFNYFFYLHSNILSVLPKIIFEKNIKKNPQTTSRLQYNPLIFKK